MCLVVVSNLCLAGMHLHGAAHACLCLCTRHPAPNMRHCCGENTTAWGAAFCGLACLAARGRSCACWCGWCGLLPCAGLCAALFAALCVWVAGLPLWVAGAGQPCAALCAALVWLVLCACWPALLHCVRVVCWPALVLPLCGLLACLRCTVTPCCQRMSLQSQDSSQWHTCSQTAHTGHSGRYSTHSVVHRHRQLTAMAHMLTYTAHSGTLGKAHADARGRHPPGRAPSICPG